VFLPSFICEFFFLRISLQIFFGKDIFGHGFGNFFSLTICFVDVFLKYVLVGVSFENCFVEIPLKGVCGGNVSSNTNTFSIEVTAEICLVWISLQRVLGREIVKTILANMFCFFSWTLKRKYVPKIFEEKSLPKSLCREIRTENLVIPFQTNFEEKFLQKYLKRKCLPGSLNDITTKKYVTKFSAKESLKRDSLPKAWREESPTNQNENIFGKIFLTVSLPRTL